MISKGAKEQEPISYKALLDENHALLDENSALQDEVQSLRTRLAEAEEPKSGITERKQMEDSLREPMRLYQSIGELIPYGIWICGLDGGVIYLSDSFLDLVGMTLDECEQFGWTDKLPPEDVERTIADWKHCIETNSFWNYEHNIRGKDGRYHTVLSRGIPINDNKGKTTLWVGINLDITERKRAEEALRAAYEKIQKQSEELQVINEELQVQSEELHEANEALSESEKRFRTLTENSPDVITRFDRENRHMYANPAASEAYGFSQEEIIGKTHGELGKSSELVKFLETYYEIVFTTGKPEAIEFHYKSPQEKEFYFNTKIVPEFVNGKVTSVLAISRDIKYLKETEAKLKGARDNLEALVKERTSELEEAYESLLENEIRLNEAQKIAHLGNWDRDISTNKLYWSDETYRIYGLDPLESGITYDSFLNYVHPDDRDYVNNAVKEALNGEPYSIDYRIISADGQERIVHSQGELVFDEKHIPVRARGIVQDITERKIAEEALERINKTRIKEIHHRIKNNLQVISSMLSLEAERLTDAKTLEAFKESQNRVISMALIHEELYKGTGTDNLDFAAYLRKLIADLFRSYNLRNDGVSLNQDLEQVYLGMDTAIPLGIIVNELVSNSLKHAFPKVKEGEISITLKRTENFTAHRESSEAENRCREGDNFHYVLTVADNGKGIPEEIEFQNVDSLGLQLVNILADQIDGCIELKRDQGTEFTVLFSDIAR